MTTSAGSSSICGGLWCIALLACGEREPYRSSQAANGHTYLHVQAAAGAAKRLIFSPPFARCSTLSAECTFPRSAGVVREYDP